MEMQETRSLGRLLVLKTRLEIAEGRIRIGDSLAANRAGMGRHVGQHASTIIQIADLRGDHHRRWPFRSKT